MTDQELIQAIATRYAVLKAENVQLRDDLEHARSLSEFAASPCPLCIYKNGVFVRRCAMHEQIDFLSAENMRLRAGGAAPFDKRCADHLADEVAVLVDRKVIDARSSAADALLDYRNPPTTDRSDRLAAIEAELEEWKNAVEGNKAAWKKAADERDMLKHSLEAMGASCVQPRR